MMQPGIIIHRLYSLDTVHGTGEGDPLSDRKLHGRRFTITSVKKQDRCQIDLPVVLCYHKFFGRLNADMLQNSHSPQGFGLKCAERHIR